MIRAGRTVVLLACMLAGCGLAWQLLTRAMAERYAIEEPEHALAWDPGNPDALISLSRHQLARGESAAAAVTARRMLAIEPLSSEAFAMLAAATEQTPNAGDIAAVFRLALRRAPRDAHARAWLIDEQLRAGNFADAIEQFGILLRTAPDQSEALLPIMVRLADDPRFAGELARSLNNDPPWRERLLSELLERGSQDARNQVLGALPTQGGSSSHESAMWFDRLMQEGRWGEAYGRWAGSLPQPAPAALPLLYNGRFEREPTSVGFDWHVGHTVGVAVSRVEAPGSVGRFAFQVSFSGRRVSDIDVFQPLLLAPGTYRMRFRARADDLRSDKGVQWVVACEPRRDPIALGPLLNGNFEWQWQDFQITISDEACAGQRLWLRNAAAAGAARGILGDVWFDDLSIVRE